ncbi:MAG: PLP-dependent transferase [Endozoicomonas sp.]|uniref:PLP-dependent transferase n=1 Tax=Endozoicomonas sp. TaxID=1892382 RepID=UPI003D9B3E8E
MDNQIPVMQRLSPVRNSTRAQDSDALATEQLQHFGIQPDTPFGQSLLSAASNLYQAGSDISQFENLCQAIASLPESDKISHFNAKKFLCFQLAKLIDMLQPSMKQDYHALGMDVSSRAVKGDYPLFANVGALFSATPAVVKTATYLYACTEWVEDAFHGKESTHPIYSRLLNPTSISLANTLTALEAGENAGEYMTWNFNSGMAAIDALLANQLRHGDILLSSRNVYGGTFQLMQDFYARPDRLAVQLEWFDGFSSESFKEKLKHVEKKYQQALQNGKKILVYLESPLQPPRQCD